MFLKLFILFSSIFCAQILSAQELFVYSEPASNMATKSIGIRVANNFMHMQGSERYQYRLVPEVMIGVSKKLMLHAETFFSNSNGNINGNFNFNGAGLYAKYRFYSQDEVHSHFRIAAFVRGAINNSRVAQRAIDLNGLNSGYEAGLIATRLINKTAISAGVSFAHALDNSGRQELVFETEEKNPGAVNYNISLGQLALPKEYISYSQTNMNLMLEALGQTEIRSGKSYLDLAPSVQFILLSKMRIDAGYRFAVIKDLYRMSNNSFLLRLEYNFFNAYK